MTTVTGYETGGFSLTPAYFQIDDGWKTASGRGVTVAVIDSGIDTAHPDLKGKVQESVEARRDNQRIVFDHSDSGDSAGHGTACAGIIGRIAPNAEFYSIKVLGAGGLGDGQAFLAGLEHAIKQRHRVINLSLGTTKPQFFSPLHDLLDRAYQAGCIVVAAANNLPQPSFPSVFLVVADIGDQERGDRPAELRVPVRRGDRADRAGRERPDGVGRRRL